MGTRRKHVRNGFSSRPDYEITPGPDTKEEFWFHNDLDSRLQSTQLTRAESRKEGTELFAWERRIEAAARAVLGGLPEVTAPISAPWCSNEWFEAAALTNFPRPERDRLAKWPSREWYADTMMDHLDYLRTLVRATDLKRDRPHETAVAVGIALGRLVKEAELKFSKERHATSGEKSVLGGRKGGKARAAKYAPEYERWVAYAKSLDPKRFKTIHAKARQVERHFDAPFDTAKRVLREKLGSVAPTDPGR